MKKIVEKYSGGHDRSTIFHPGSVSYHADGMNQGMNISFRPMEIRQQVKGLTESLKHN